MPIRTVSFLAGALVALVVAGTVAFVNAPDPWEGDPDVAAALEEQAPDAAQEPAAGGSPRWPACEALAHEDPGTYKYHVTREVCEDQRERFPEGVPDEGLTAEGYRGIPEPDLPIAGYFESIEAAARACITIEAGRGGADGRYGMIGCQRAREEHGDDLDVAIAAERDRMAALEAYTNRDPRVCEFAEAYADTGGPGDPAITDVILTACEQVRAGGDVDRPDVVACYERTDELGGTHAGRYPTESCDELALSDPIAVEAVDDLARARQR